MPLPTAQPAAEPTPAPTYTDPDALALASRLASDIVTGAITSARSLQTMIGGSEIGAECDRKIVYRLTGVKPTNLRDPLRTLVGLGLHHVLADIFTRANAGSARYLVEYPAPYAGIPGSTDLHDRWVRTVIDWKVTTLQRIRQIRREGPTRQQTTQIHTYAASLIEQGEDVVAVALVFIPSDGTLDDIFVWRSPVDISIAVMAAERIERLSKLTPVTATAKPSRLCPWCSHYRPGSTDIATGCPGEGKER